jgi:hypothetical protein
MRKKEGKEKANQKCGIQGRPFFLYIFLKMESLAFI